MDDGTDALTLEGEHVGVITHFFDKISVAVVKAEKPMKVGDKIRVYDREGNVIVEQEITSMEIDRAALPSVEAGQEFGLKVDGVVKEGYMVHRLS